MASAARSALRETIPEFETTEATDNTEPEPELACNVRLLKG